LVDKLKGGIKRMRLKLLLAAVFLSGMALAQELPEPKGGVTIYVVRPGDSLWKISRRFFNNPLLWPRLWELNPYIDNPNLIYPGEALSLKPAPPKVPTLPVVKIIPEIKVKTVEGIEPPPPVFFYSRAEGEGFVQPDEWEHMGTIISSEPPKILLGEGDAVYANVGSQDNVQPGDKFTIFRTGKTVLHPVTGRRIGFKVAVLGELEILEVLGKKMSSAKITYSSREITRGARIRPLEPFVKEVVLKKGVQKADGYIVATLNSVELSGRGDVVYIDVGQEEGVVPGNTFSIYTRPRSAFDPDAGTSVVVPGALLGKLVVLNVQKEAATGIIIESARQITKGDVVRLDL
jgi:LysM domain-containing protein